MLLKSLKYLLKGIGIILSPILIYFIISIILTLIPVNRNYVHPTEGVDILLRTNGIHADFVFPIQNEHFNWLQFIDVNDYQVPISSRSWVSIGWGDKIFYLETPEWSDLTVKNALSSLLLNTPSTIHIECFAGKFKPHENLKEIRLSKEQYIQLCTFIKETAQLESNGKFELIDVPGYKNYDRFYEAVPDYNCINTCNTWVNQALKEIGIRSSVWTPFDRGIFWQLSKIKS